MNIRPRRNRKSSAIRHMVEETKLGVENLIYPIFLKDGKNIKEEVSSLPNNKAYLHHLKLNRYQINPWGVRLQRMPHLLGYENLL